MVLLLILALLFPFQEKSDQFKQEISGFRNKGKFSVTYDKFQDRSRVTVGPFAPMGPQFYLSARFTFKGQAVESDVNEFFVFFQTSGREWSLLRDRRVYLLVGNERFDLGEGRHDGNIERRGRGVSESLIVSVPAGVFQKLGTSSAAFKVGRHEVTLNDEHLEAFRDLYKLSRRR
jgi:hypothetical protein